MGDLVADPDGAAVWARRLDDDGARSWWRIPVDGDAPVVAPYIPDDATDLRIRAGGDPIAWTRIVNGLPIHEWWSASHLDSSRSAVWRSAFPVIGFTCRGVPVQRRGDAIRLAPRNDPPVVILTTDRRVGMPANQSRYPTLIGPVQGRHARVQSMLLLGGSLKFSSDGDDFEEPSRSVELTPGTWRRTSLDTDRHVVLLDADRGRLGVFDRVEYWFAEVPFVARWRLTDRDASPWANRD